MTTQVLYRKWRPHRFRDVVGQEPVTLTLSRAVSSGRLAHAFLFAGPRGTGKTSTARILAKAVSCEDREEGDGDPDGTCATCLSIDNGSFLDLIEIDGASNRGIDEIRNLREKVLLAPTQGSHKIYIIDEAHMLTTEAFNAFLKTLEEPPPNTIFILATTEAHLLPLTIISRCQRFDFKRISMTDVVSKLTDICTSEKVSASPEVLRTIAKAGGGSLRDATNLLDQCITSYGSNLELQHLQEMFGSLGDVQSVTLVKHLLSGNTAQALTLINSLASEGMDLRPFHQTTVDFLRAILLMKTGVKDPLDLGKETSQELSFIAKSVTQPRILRALKLFGQIKLKHDQPSPLPLELATVELNLEPEATPSSSVNETQKLLPPPVHSQQLPSTTSRTTNSNKMLSPASADSSEGRTRDHQPTTDPALTDHWPGIVRSMSKVKGKRFDIGALLRSSSARHLDGSTLVVRFSHLSNSERLQDELSDTRCKEAFEAVLLEMLGGSYSIRVEASESQAGGPNSMPSHLVQTAINLGAKMVPDISSQQGANEPEANEVKDEQESPE